MLQDFDSSLLKDYPQFTKYYEFEEALYNLPETGIDEVKEKIKAFSPEEYPHLRMCVAASASRHPFMLKELSEIWISMGEVKYSFLWGSIFVEYLAKKGIIASHLVPEYIQPSKSYIMMENVFPEGSVGDCIRRDDLDAFVTLSANESVLTDKIDFFDQTIDPLALAAFCSSIKCFRYMFLNRTIIDNEITKEIVKYAIKGGSTEIIELAEQNGMPIDASCLPTAFKYHNHEIAQWIIENFGIGDLGMIDCITSMNALAIVFGLANNLSIEKVDKDSHNVLISASCIGYEDLVDILLRTHRNDIDLEARETTGMTALTYAAFNGHSHIVSKLIDAGANVESETDENVTPLLTACTMGQKKCVEILVNKGNASLKKTANGFAPLIFASYHGSADIIEFLLSTGKIDNINDMDLDKKTALHYAASHNFYEATKVLLENGANPNLFDSDHQTPLYLSILNSEEEEEIEINEEEEEEEEEIIEDQQEEDNKEKDQQQQEDQQEEEEEEEDVDGGQIVSVKYKNEVLKVVELLLKKGSDMYVKDIEGFSLIDNVITMGSPDIVRLFIENGLDVNKKDPVGQTALHVSIMNNFYDIAKELIDAGADVNAVNDDGETPLFCAETERNMKIIKLLVDSGADVNHCFMEKITPLSIARSIKHKKLIKFLIESGAKD